MLSFDGDEGFVLVLFEVEHGVEVAVVEVFAVFYHQGEGDLVVLVNGKLGFGLARCLEIERWLMCGGLVNEGKFLPGAFVDGTDFKDIHKGVDIWCEVWFEYIDCLLEGVGLWFVAELARQHQHNIDQDDEDDLFRPAGAAAVVLLLIGGIVHL